MNKLMKKIFLCSYIGVILTPMLIHWMGSSQQSEFENRKLSNWPELPQQLTEWNQYPEQINTYLDDRFGMREFLIQSANRIKYNVFNELISNQITPGKDGYIFFNSHSSSKPDALIKAACGQNPINHNYRDKTIRGFAHLLKYFERKNTQAALSVVPIKARIYPEKLPIKEQRWCQASTSQWADELMSQLHKLGLQVYSPLEKMSELKQHLQVYLPTFFHWHGEAPQLIATDLLQRLWQIEQRRFNLEPEQIWVRSDLRSHLTGLNLGDSSYKYDYSKVGVEVCASGRCDLEADRFFHHRSLVYQYRAENQSGRRLLMFSDSYGAYISAHFIQGFDQVIQIDLSGIKRDQILDFYEYTFAKYKPTHSLYLIHEGGIWGSSLINEALERQIKAINRF